MWTPVVHSCAIGDSHATSCSTIVLKLLFCRGARNQAPSPEDRVVPETLWFERINVSSGAWFVSVVGWRSSNWRLHTCAHTHTHVQQAWKNILWTYIAAKSLLCFFCRTKHSPKEISHFWRFKLHTWDRHSSACNVWELVDNGQEVFRQRRCFCVAWYLVVGECEKSPSKVPQGLWSGCPRCLWTRWILAKAGWTLMFAPHVCWS